MDWSLVIVPIILLVFYFIRSKVKNNEAWSNLIDSLQHGVMAAYEDLYKKYKALAADGKLTEEQKKELREYALEKAKEVMTPDAKRILLALGKEYALTLINRIVARYKK